MPAKSKQFVIVTTEHRGVFAGYLESDRDAPTVALSSAQMCVYWPQSVQGVVGLAVTGPLKGSRVTPAAPKMTLSGVTSVMDATPEAVSAWQARPWS